jgi:hypothetical protein
MTTFAHTRQSVTAAIKGLQAQGPSFSIQSVTPINKQFARITGTIVAKATGDQVMNAVRNATGSKIIPIKGTFQAIASNSITKSVEGIVGILEQRVVLSDNNRDAYKAVAANMYMDSEEHLWSLRKTDAGDILIKSHASDDLEVMNHLMTCVASNAVGSMEALPASGNLNLERAGIEGGDLVSYVNEEGCVDMAFVVASVDDGVSDQGLVVVNRDNNINHIDRNLVVAAIASADIEADDTAELEAVAAGNYSMEFIADYYRKMFMRRPDYFAKFWERFMNHKGIIC